MFDGCRPIDGSSSAVAHRAGELHALPLAGGERGGGPVEGQIAQPQLQQPPGGALKRFADAFRHRAHFRGKRGGNAGHPPGKRGERHPAGFVEADSAQFRGARRRRQARAAAFGADLLFQELFHPLHAFFVLHLGQRVFDGVGGVVIGEVKLSGLIGVFGFVQNVPLFGGAAVDDLALLRRQLPERDVGADPHRAADIRHQRPHQRIPRRDSALID